MYRVEPVTRGERLARFFWHESMVRGDEARRLLFDMDAHLMALRGSVGEADGAVIGLTGTHPQSASHVGRRLICAPAPNPVPNPVSPNPV